MIYDCVVIGAGISGLASSIILSRNGLKTALVEKSGKTGPLVRGFRRKGHYFDTGFHHAGGIGEGSSGQAILSYLGVSKHLTLVPCNPDCFDVIRFSDSSFEFQFPIGYDMISERLHEAFPGDKPAIDAYIHEIKRQCSLLPFLNLDADLNSVNILENVHGSSLEEFLSGLTDNELLKSVLTVHCLLNGVPPDEQALNNYAYIVGPYYESVNYIRGGGSAVITALEEEARENGVDIFLKKNASKLIFSSAGDLSGVSFQDESIIECKKCISTIHPLQLLSLVPDSRFRPSYISRIKSLDETLSAYILYGNSEIDLKALFGTSLYLLPGAGIDAFSCNNPLEERTFNIVSIEGDKPEKHTGNEFVAICPASIEEARPWADSRMGSRPPEYKAFKEKIKERMFKHIQSSCPELNGKITALDCSTPLTLRDYSNSPYGSMYGIKHKIDQFNPFPVTKVPGLYLAGQSIVSPGLLGAIISALFACGSILGHDLIKGEIKKWG